MERMSEHVLRLSAGNDATIAECSCARWRREATTETLAVTGVPREEALRAAHERHLVEPEPVELTVRDVAASLG